MVINETIVPKVKNIVQEIQIENLVGWFKDYKMQFKRKKKRYKNIIVSLDGKVLKGSVFARLSKWIT